MSESRTQDQVRRALRHDLRNPLSIILGRCELLESGVLGPLEPVQQESIAVIERHARRIVDEIDRLAALLEDPSSAPR